VQPEFHFFGVWEGYLDWLCLQLGFFFFCLDHTVSRVFSQLFLSNKNLVPYKSSLILRPPLSLGPIILQSNSFPLLLLVRLLEVFLNRASDVNNGLGLAQSARSLSLPGLGPGTLAFPIQVIFIASLEKSVAVEGVDRFLFLVSLV